MRGGKSLDLLGIDVVGENPSQCDCVEQDNGNPKVAHERVAEGRHSGISSLFLQLVGTWPLKNPGQTTNAAKSQLFEPFLHVGLPQRGQERGMHYK